MKLGLSTWSLLNTDVCSAVKAIGDLGLGYIELWGELPHAYPGWVDKGDLRDALSTYDMTVTVHAPFTDLNPASHFQPVRGAIEKALGEFVEFSASLGAVKATVHPGSVHNERLVPRSAQDSLDMLEKMTKAADGRLSINVENQTRSTSRYYYPLGSTLESLESLLDDLAGSECTFDTGHAFASGQDILGMAERLGDRVTEVHLSDNAGSVDDHLIPGSGTAPLHKFMERISGRDVLVCLELNPHRYAQGELLSAVRALASGHVLEPGAARGHSTSA